MNGSWLSLTDYSTKYRVSVSTLRRRIKSEDIQFKLSDGKYFILDEPLSGLENEERNYVPSSLTISMSEASDLGTHRPSQSNVQSSEAMMQHMTEETKKVLLQTQQLTEKFKSMKEEPILTAANRLLGELKKAYSQVLQEKEEQIFQLKEEVTDLKTLVRVLEGENDRLMMQKQKSPTNTTY